MSTNINSEVKFTPEQQQAIDTRTSEVLVTAAAGSGKTAVLVERIVNLILADKISIDTLVILTFTNAAATQMRNRVRLRLQELLLEVEFSQKQYLQEQLLLLPSASISTFHAFCIKILRRYYQYLDLSPSFKIADEHDIANMKEQALDQVFDQAFAAAEPQFLNFATAHISSTNTSQLRQLILTIYEKSRAFAFPDKWQKEARNWLNDTKKIAILQNEYQAYWQSCIINYLQALQDVTQKIINFPKNVQTCQYVIEQLQNILLTITTDFNLAQEQLSQVDYLNWARIKADDKTADSEYAYKIFSETKSKIRELASAQYTLDSINKQQQLCAPFVNVLLNCVSDFSTEFMQMKKQKDVVDFADLEHFMIKLLANNQEIRQNIAKDITEMLVDEYQDTNEIQDTILQYLKTDQNRLFMVGDLKQSIYRFRLADPTIFMHKTVTFADNSNETLLISLNKNFRSRSTILETANTICEFLFQLDIKYDNTNKLYHGNQKLIADQDPPVIWHVFTEEPEKKAFRVRTKAELQAAYIVKRIQNCLLNEKIFEPKTQEFRQVVASDIAVLFRNKTADLIQAIEQQFEVTGINYSSAVDKGYFSAVEVNNILSLLVILENPMQDIDLLAYLRSPMENYQDSDIFLLRQSMGKDAISYYEAIERYCQNNDNDLVTRLLKTQERLIDYQQMVTVLPLAKVLRHIYEKSNYYYFVSALPNGTIRKANLDILIALANDRSEIGINDLHAFNQYLQKIQQQKRDFAIAKNNAEQNDVIEMMTIHKSKGLEFPIVFLVDLDHQFNTQDSRALFQTSNNKGLALRYTDITRRTRAKTWHYENITLAQSRDTMSEELRILYVALTRAMQQLHLCLTDYPQWLVPTANDVLSMKTFGEGLINSFYANIPQHQAIWKRCLVDIDDVEISSTAELVEAVPNINNDFQIDQFANEIIVKTKELATENYRFAAMNEYAQKQTVTEIKRQEELQEDLEMNFFAAPMEDTLTIDKTLQPSFMNEKMITPLEKGTLYHFLLQIYDWINFPDVQQFLDDLLGEKIITILQYSEISIENLTKTIKRVQDDYLTKGYEIFALEYPFSFEYSAAELYQTTELFTTETVLVQGKIDMILKNGKNYVVIDFKTDKGPSVDKEAKLAQKYTKQLELYAKAMQHFLEVPTIETKIYAVFI